MGSKRAIITVLLSAWVILTLFSTPVGAQSRPYKKGELLVRYKSGLHSVDTTALERTARVIASQSIGRSRIHRIRVQEGTTVEQAVALYANDPNVEFAEPNYLVHPQRLANDAYFNQQWGLHNTGQVVSEYTDKGTPGFDMDAPLAWDLTTGSDEVVVAVVDTGCDLNHPDLAANIWRNPDEIPGNGLDDDGNGFIDDTQGWDFSDDDNVPQDATGHGSHVAGIIAAIGDNARGIAGVAWQVKIMPLRFMNAFNEGSVADAIQAIDYALAKGVKIINCSWGNSSSSTALQNVMANADALFICASGNNASDTDLQPFYPAGFSNGHIISVAASDQKDQLAWFSNYGTASVDVAAPGAWIYSLSLNDGHRTLWQENFNAGLPESWLTGGSGDTWAAADPPYTVNAPALALSPDADYINSADTWAQAPVQDLGQASASQLTFKIIGRSQANRDILRLEISTDGSIWNACPLEIGGVISTSGISGTIAYWTTAKADLEPWDGEPRVFVRLRFNSDATDTDIGFYIDDMQLTAADESDSYQFMHGTSMAAGYVSGLAALILSENSALTPAELKTIIETSVDLKQNLLEQVASGGRVNAYNALTLLRELSLTAASAAADRIQLSWTAQSPLNSEATIERRTDSQSDFETVAWVEAGATTYSDVALSANSIYFYRVQAQTQDGRSGYSNQTLATTQNPPAASSAGGGGGGGGCFITTLGQR